MVRLFGRAVEEGEGGRLDDPPHIAQTGTDKIIELMQRGGGLTDLETRPMVDQGISMGRGGVFLSFTEEECRKLKL